MSDARHETITEAEDGQRLDRWLKKRLPAAPQSLIFKLCRTGQVRVDGKRAKAEQKLVMGQDVRIPPASTPDPKEKGGMTEKDRTFIKSLVIYDDGDLVAINKPGDIATQGGTGTFRHIDGLLDGLKNKDGIAPRLVHRLDKETSGVLLLARSGKAVRELGFMFKGRQMEKIYVALVAPAPQVLDGTIDAALSKAEGRDKERMILDPENGQKAFTDFKVIDYAARQAAFVAFRPRTGRTHQIRAHAAYALETPMIGDQKYGYQHEGMDEYVTTKRLHLHAARLTFPHPVKGHVVDLRAPLPADIAKTWKSFGFKTDTNVTFDAV